MQMDIYRFVSWRDEECSIVGLDSLDSLPEDISALSGAVDSLLSQAGLVDGLFDSLLSENNLIASLVFPTNAQITFLLRPILGPLFTQIRTLQSATLAQLDPVLDSAGLIGGLIDNLNGLSPALTALDNVLGPLTTPLSELIDLCDLDLESLEGLSQLGTVSTLLANADAATPGISSALGELLDEEEGLPNLIADVTDIREELEDVPTSGLSALLVGVLNPIIATVDGLVDNVTAAVSTLLGNPGDPLDLLETSIEGLPDAAQLAGLVDNLTADIETLLNQPDTARNTKRVTIAVVLHERNATGPFKPVWVSTVITDPEAGFANG